MCLGVYVREKEIECVREVKDKDGFECVHEREEERCGSSLCLGKKLTGFKWQV